MPPDSPGLTIGGGSVCNHVLQTLAERSEPLADIGQLSVALEGASGVLSTLRGDLDAYADAGSLGEVVGIIAGDAAPPLPGIYRLAVIEEWTEGVLFSTQRQELIALASPFVVLGPFLRLYRDPSLRPVVRERDHGKSAGIESHSGGTGGVAAS